MRSNADRDIDRLIDFINGMENMPKVMKQIMINRLNAGPPTPQELEKAKSEVFYGPSVWS